jgi:hypothetical protein
MLLAIAYLISIVASAAVALVGFSDEYDVLAFGGVLAALAATFFKFAPSQAQHALIACVIGFMAALLTFFMTGKKISFFSIPLRLAGVVGAVWVLVVALTLLG